MFKFKDKDQKHLSKLGEDVAYWQERAADLERRLSVYEQYDQKPQDCERGQWCYLCAYSEVKPIPLKRDRYFTYDRPAIVCKKGACKHFTPVTEKE